MRNRSSKYFVDAATRNGTNVCIVLEDGAYRVEICHDAQRTFSTYCAIQCTDRAHALEVASKACRQAIRRGKVEDVKQREIACYA